MLDEIPEPSAGDEFTIEEWAKLVKRCNRQITGDDYFGGEFGTIILKDRATTSTAPRYFELKDNHNPGTTTIAHPQDWNSSSNEWETDTDIDREFDITDPLGLFRGRGKDSFDSPHDKGSLGVAEKNSESGDWEIIRMQPHALWLVGDVWEDFSSSESIFAILNPEVAFPVGGIITDIGDLSDPNTLIFVYNIHGWSGTAHAKAEVKWNEQMERWECTELDC